MGFPSHSLQYQEEPSVVALNHHIAIPPYATASARLRRDAFQYSHIRPDATSYDCIPSQAAVCGCVGCYSIACGRMQRDAVAYGRIASSRDAYHGLRWNQDGCGRNRSLAIVWEPLRPQANQCEGMRFGAYTTTIIVLVVVVVVKRNAMV